jgi:hypothetical protein
MGAHNSTTGVMAFLDSYRRAFDAYDTQAIVDHFAFPCAIVGDADTILPKIFEGPEQCGAGVDVVLSLHREIGVASGRPLLLQITELSPRLAGMMIRIQFHDAQGRPLYDFQGLYSLAHTESGYRIAAITHNQIPRLLACAGRPSVPIS